MDSSKLKLNPDKTELFLFGSKFLHNKLSHLFPVNILDNLLSPSEKVPDLGVIFVPHFVFSAQVSSICSSSYYHIHDFARIRCYLVKSTAIAVANALVSSWLDYCNSLLNSISEYNLKRLNSVFALFSGPLVFLESICLLILGRYIGFL